MGHDPSHFIAGSAATQSQSPLPSHPAPVMDNNDAARGAARAHGRSDDRDDASDDHDDASDCEQSNGRSPPSVLRHLNEGFETARSSRVRRPPTQPSELANVVRVLGNDAIALPATNADEEASNDSDASSTTPDNIAPISIHELPPTPDRYKTESCKCCKRCGRSRTRAITSST